MKEAFKTHKNIVLIIEFASISGRILKIKFYTISDNVTFEKGSCLCE